ncbi:MAG: TerB family tellurite resistance protein [Bacteroidales bacterium]|nr:TerB family tellurite resistance protein [Bacteroidales bacterium]
MALFSFKQLIYGGMVAIAGVDGEVTSKEVKFVNEVFDKYLKINSREKKEVITIWNDKGDDGFTQILIDELNDFPKRDQIEAFTYIMKFISWSKTQYNQSKDTEAKGVDPVRAEMDLYHKKAEKIMRALAFNAKEYSAATRTGRPRK